MLLKTIIKWVWDVLALRWEGQEAWGPWKGRWSRSTFNFPVTIFALPQTPLLWSAGRPLHGQVGADYPAGSSFPSSTVIREGAGACTYTLCVFGKVVTPLRPNLPYLWGMPVVAVWPCASYCIYLVPQFSLLWSRNDYGIYLKWLYEG